MSQTRENYPSRRATSRDVAAAAGVSRTTVSFVLNNTPNQVIPESTRARVLEAAARLAYAPSAEARALSRGRTDVVLLYLPPTLPLTSDVGSLIEQLSSAFAEAGMTMVAHPWVRQPASDVWAAVTPSAVLAWSLDDVDADAMRGNGIRVVTSLTGSDVIGRWVTGAREDEIARAQVGRLMAAGHERLAYAMPRAERMGPAGRLRSAALEKACAAMGVPAPTLLELPLDPDECLAETKEWRATNSAVSGICAHDVTSALAVVAGMRNLGFTTPVDFAVIGVNDSPHAAFADPPLTMVSIDARGTADYIVAAITALLDPTEPPLPTAPTGLVSVVERRSV